MSGSAADCATMVGVADLRADPLALDRETMRELGYRTIDMLVERLGDTEAR
jgi:hypothetical protein